MYSGNHSPCHPLDTLMGAAVELKTRDDVVFCFIGGGSEHAKVRDFAARHELGNVSCLPYQPLGELSSSLSAADMHVVVMGEAFVGIVHPCKVYNIMSVGAPVLYIGPTPSHITDLSYSGMFFTHHGDVTGVVSRILEGRTQLRTALHPQTQFSKHTLLPELIDILEAEPVGIGHLSFDIFHLSSVRTSAASTSSNLRASSCSENDK
jgi:hypothetical protein